MKSQKASKKPQKNNSIDYVVTSRAVVGLLIVLLAASVLTLFKTYQNSIMSSNMFYPFMILTFIGMGLLVSLLFLVNPSHARRK